MVKKEKEANIFKKQRWRERKIKMKGDARRLREKEILPVEERSRVGWGSILRFEIGSAVLGEEEIS